MDILIAITMIVIFVGALAGSIAGNVIAAEIYDWCPTIARAIVKRAVSRLPGQIQNRYHEEWSAHLDECPTKLGKICHALGCYFAIPAITSDFEETEKALVRHLNEMLDDHPMARQVIADIALLLERHLITSSDDEAVEAFADEYVVAMAKYEIRDAEVAYKVYKILIERVNIPY